MRTHALITIGLTLVAGTCAIADASKRPSRPRAEPDYTTAQPFYCRILCKAKTDVDVWIVIDGDSLYIDRNGNGDLTEKGERLKKPEEDKPVEADFTSTKLQRRFRDVKLRWRHAQPNPFLEVSVRVDGRYVLDSILSESLAAQPRNAPVVVMGGELRLFTFGSPRFLLWTGNNARTILPLTALLGTKSETNDYAYVEPQSLPKGVHPVAEIRYAPAKAGSIPRRQLVDIKRRVMNYFIGTASVPSGTSPGPATITFRMKTLKKRDMLRQVKPTVVKATLPKFEDLPTVGPKADPDS